MHGCTYHTDVQWSINMNCYEWGLPLICHMQTTYILCYAAEAAQPRGISRLFQTCQDHQTPSCRFIHGYGSIPINTIFRGMNINLPAILMFTRGTRFWHTATSRMKPWNHFFWRGLRWARCPLAFGGWRSTWQCYRRSCIMPRRDITGPRFGRFHWKNPSLWFLGGNIPKSRKNGNFFGPCLHGFICLLVLLRPGISAWTSLQRSFQTIGLIIWVLAPPNPGRRFRCFPVVSTWVYDGTFFPWIFQVLNFSASGRGCWFRFAQDIPRLQPRNCAMKNPIVTQKYLGELIAPENFVGLKK